MQQPRPCRLPWLPLLLALGTSGALAQRGPASLTDLSLEQLSDIEVTSVGKRVQRLADVPGSVYIISQEDIRRSGAVTLPEILRLAPNLQVARADANQYAITSRGFSSVLANKMLVLVDGRTVYSPLFSGVFWEVQDTVVEDIERIEVLSGAGGTLYGSNAVNGVIHIITRSAADTQGGVLKGIVGNSDRAASVRWGGGAAAGVPWRAYAKTYHTDATRLENGASAGDAGRREQAGFRGDYVRDGDQLTVQGDIYQARIDQLPAERALAGANLLARWSRDDGAGVRTQLQGWFDRADRNQPGLVDDTLQTWDIELQQTRKSHAGHELLWGAGHRWMHDRLANLAPATLQVLPTDRRLKLWNVFAQQELQLAPRWRATVGLKAEHNTYTGLEWLPTAKLAWQPTEGHLLWASVERAVRTPSRIDRDVSIPGLLVRGTGFASEVAKVYELGWRAQPRPNVNYSVTLFHHDFEQLRSVDLVPGGFTFANSYRGHLDGVEAWGSWLVAESWRVQAGYVHQRLRLGPDAGSSAAPSSMPQLANDPRNRVQFGLGWDMAHNMELDLQARHVGSLPSPDVPSYTALDLRWGWRVRPDVELSFVVRNLTDAHHPEWGAASTRAEIPRSFHIKAVWRL